MVRKPGRISSAIRAVMLSRRFRERGRIKRERLQEGLRRLREQEERGRAFYESYLVDEDYYHQKHHHLMEKFDIFTKEEKKLYAFFMNKKPGKTLAERIEFASFVSELITDLRGCTPEEKSFFDRFFGDFKKKNKDPDVLLRYAFRLENLILRSRAKGTVFNPETLFSDEEVTEPQNYDE